jgi:hypothetical protein
MPEPALEDLRAEARYRQERLALYRARVLTGRESSDNKLRLLEREAAQAQERLEWALQHRDHG